VRVEAYDNATYLRHQRVILNYFGCGPFDEAARVFTAGEIGALVRVQFRPKLVLLEVIQILLRKKVPIPSYNVLADLIVAGLNRHQSMLSEIVSHNLNEDLRRKLDDLLEKEPGGDNEAGWRYRPTLMKKPSQSSRPSRIKTNLADLQTLQGLYLDLKPVSQRLGLSYECIRYYAYSVIKAQVPQMSRRADEDRYLHLIAFVIYQTFKLNDTLIDTLLMAVQAAANAAEREHKDAYFQERERRNQSFSALIDQLKRDIQETLSSIKQIMADTRLSDREKLAKIDAALNAEATESGKADPFDTFQQSAEKLQQGQGYLALLEARSLKLQHRSHPI